MLKFLEGSESKEKIERLKLEQGGKDCTNGSHSLPYSFGVAELCSVCYFKISEVSNERIEKKGKVRRE